MGEQSGDKSEEPTPHKLQEARKKGQVVKSKEVTTAMLVLMTYLVLHATAKGMLEQVLDYFRYAWSYLGEEMSMSVIGHLLQKGLFLMLLLLAPILATIFGVALLIEALQTGFNVSSEPLMPKLSKINPIEGLKRMFSMKGLVELIKSIVKMAIIFFIMQGAIMSEIHTIMMMSEMTIMQSVAVAGRIAYQVAIRVALFYLVIAAFDYFYQRYEFMKQMKMSKQEVKEEYKRLEGDPLIKQRMRDAQRAASQGRRSKGAAGADAVVTNPTHLAVAIKYDATMMRSPMVVAKGKMLVAELIKKIAAENNVLIFERPELAQQLYATTEIGQEIPADLFKPIAHLLAFVYDIRKRRTSRNA